MTAASASPAAEFRARLGLAVPLIQAPMAGVQGGALATAVAGAGALGSLPGAAMTPQALRDAVTALRAAQPGAAVNLNFFSHSAPAPDPAREAAWRAALRPYYDELGVDPGTIPDGPGRLPFGEEAVAVVEALRPEVVSFHFGLPAPALVERVRAAGAQVWSSATTVDEALWLAARGVDAVIAQGAEAGGHRGVFLGDSALALATQVGTMALLPQVAAAVRVPVIAAGGIADAAGVAAAMRLGAAAVQVGTAFLLCPESTTSAVHRAALQSAAARETALTNLFTGRPARGILNRVMRELGPISALAPAFPGAVNALAPLRAAAEQAGRGDFSPLWAGQNASGCRAVPAAAIVQALAEGF
ncbi:MAG: NAD(P)H-dependent flavin oxidoreductase [Burkholderiaceae bacterium]